VPSIDWAWVEKASADRAMAMIAFLMFIGISFF
jgi:hypothetical protein